MDVEEESLSEIIDFEERRVTMYVGQTQYEVVKEVGRDIFGWKLSNCAKEDWDLCWMDERVTPERLMRMRAYQRVNHFPGMHSLSHKNCLAVNLTDMRQLLPSEYSFFPKTWLLPKDYVALKREFKEKRNRTFIVKPEAESQGRGIYLTRDLERIPIGTKCVVQKYLGKPMLIDGLKFDLRIYVLVASCDPLRIYIHQDGLARFATEPYQSPLSSNLSTTYMHLTNYAINKNNSKFIFNNEAQKDDVGHKRSLKAAFRKLEEMGRNTEKLWKEIGDIAVKTLLSAQPMLSHVYRSCHPGDSPSLCFEILGLDILIDHKLKPWLLEVNHSPSFTTDTPLDSTVKKRVIADALTLVGVYKDSRELYQRLVEDRMSQHVNWTTSKRLLSKTFVEGKKKQPIIIRKRTEDMGPGGYQKLYPPEASNDTYQSCMEASLTIWRSRIQPAIHIHRSLFPKPVIQQESLPPQGPRRLSFSNKRMIKVPSASSIGMDQSFMRPIILRRVPKGSFVTPKTLKFGILASRKPGSQARIGLKVVRIRDC